MDEGIYDVIIIGGGPAGLTAAIYTSRYGLKTLLLAKSPGGTANLAPEIENWPGFFGSGLDLMNNFKKQAEGFGAIIKMREVLEVERKDSFFVKTTNEMFKGRSIIIALGTEHRKLDIVGEEEFLGKGVSYCATCDGNFFKNKEVAVIGGANSAASVALYLSRICKKVYIIYRRDKMRCEPISLIKLKEKENVEIIYFATPTKILGNNRVEKIEIEIERGDKKEKALLDVNGIFIEIGAAPLTELIKKLGIKLDSNGYIETDKDMKTSVEGAFAAGDNTNNSLKQIITAAGEGATAANSAYEYLKTRI